MDYKYLSGNAFKNLCKYSVGHYTSARDHSFSFKIKKNLNNNFVFIKTEYIPLFFKLIDLDFKFTIVTHNSDIPIDKNFIPYIANPQVEKWYGQNINLHHPKLKSIPIGLANPKWAHGNPEIMELAISKKHWKNKNNLIYCNFDVGTNPPERFKCLEKSGISNATKVPFHQYLRDMGSSYFALSPNGNGIDCHKHWEALYLKTIPIVTKSINMEFYKDFPFLVIDDWDNFKSLRLSKETYKKIWNNFDSKNLAINNFLPLP